MPAKKTFNSIRVRGPVRLDASLSVNGVALAPYYEYVGHLSLDVNGQVFHQRVLHSHFSAPAWVKLSTGRYSLEVNLPLDPEKFLPPVLQKFRDDDGNTIRAEFIMSGGLPSQVATFVLSFINEDADDAFFDAAGFNIYLDFRIYK